MPLWFRRSVGQKRLFKIIIHRLRKSFFSWNNSTPRSGVKNGSSETFLANRLCRFLCGCTEQVLPLQHQGARWWRKGPAKGVSKRAGWKGRRKSSEGDWKSVDTTKGALTLSYIAWFLSYHRNFSPLIKDISMKIFLWRDRYCTVYVHESDDAP